MKPVTSSSYVVPITMTSVGVIAGIASLIITVSAIAIALAAIGAAFALIGIGSALFIKFYLNKKIDPQPTADQEKKNSPTFNLPPAILPAQPLDPNPPTDLPVPNYRNIYATDPDVADQVKSTYKILSLTGRNYWVKAGPREKIAVFLKEINKVVALEHAEHVKIVPFSVAPEQITHIDARIYNQGQEVPLNSEIGSHSRDKMQSLWIIFKKPFAPENLLLLHHLGYDKLHVDFVAVNSIVERIFEGTETNLSLACSYSKALESDIKTVSDELEKPTTYTHLKSKPAVLSHLPAGNMDAKITHAQRSLTAIVTLSKEILTIVNGEIELTKNVIQLHAIAYKTISNMQTTHPSTQFPSDIVDLIADYVCKTVLQYKQSPLLNK